MKLILVFLLLLIPLSSAYPTRQISNNSIYSNEYIVVNVTYPDNSTDIVEIIPACFNVNSTLNFTVSDINSKGYYFNSTNFEYTIIPVTCDYNNYTISGAYNIGNETRITSDPTYITYYSPYISLYRKYDVNNNGVISKDEVLKSVVDYFNNLLTRNETMKLTDKYLHPPIKLF